ncbi:hypothetical protein JL722_7734 [Aureococcus anophagefferens]|nr:hypothetical protein JL722_7734 [Aureococcus anophagefferens]
MATSPEAADAAATESEVSALLARREANVAVELRHVRALAERWREFLLPALAVARDEAARLDGSRPAGGGAAALLDGELGALLDAESQQLVGVESADGRPRAASDHRSKKKRRRDGPAAADGLPRRKFRVRLRLVGANVRPNSHASALYALLKLDSPTVLARDAAAAEAARLGDRPEAWDEEALLSSEYPPAWHAEHPRPGSAKPGTAVALRNVKPPRREEDLRARVAGALSDAALAPPLPEGAEMANEHLAAALGDAGLLDERAVAVERDRAAGRPTPPAADDVRAQEATNTRPPEPPALGDAPHCAAATRAAWARAGGGALAKPSEKAFSGAMNDDQSDIRRSVSMSHGLLMASSPEQVGRKRSRREQTGRPGHRRIHSEPVHVAAPTDDVDLFPMWSLADDPIMALDVEPSTPEWARVMEHCATSFGGGGGDSPGLGLGRKKGNFGDLPGAFYGDDDEDLGATRRNASHSLDAATLCDGLSPMTTEAFRKAILPAIAKDDRAAAAKPRAAAPRKAPAGKGGKGKGGKGDDAKGDGDRTGAATSAAAAARSR